MGKGVMKPKILVIEDEVSIVELLKYNLTASGFDVDVCFDGDSALDNICLLYTSPSPRARG